MTTTSSPALDLQLQGVGKRYASPQADSGALQVLDGIDLNIPAGEFLSIVGASGCGKSTLLRLVLGLDAQYEGQITLGGEPLRGTGPERGIVFQDHRLFPWLTVAQNIAVGLRNARASAAEKRDRVAEHIALVGLEGFEQSYPHQISGGMAQRVAIARGLVNRPRVLLLDEPFGALDAKVRKELRRWLRRLHDELHVASVFVTHDQEEALEVSDRVVLMNAGRIEQVGSPREVWETPATPFVYGFLGDVNQLPGQAAGGVWRHADLALPAPELAQPGALAATAYVRPHEIEVLPYAPRQPGIPVRLAHAYLAGPSAYLELTREDAASVIEAEVPEQVFRELNLKEGDALLARPRRARVFATQP